MLNKWRRTEKCRALKRLTVAPAENTLRGGQFGGQGGQGARDGAHSSSAVDQGWASVP